MGIDIYGWVEVQLPYLERWLGVIKLDPSIAFRDYEMFESLFRDLDRGYFHPIAAFRGLPDDISRETQESILDQSRGFHEYKLDASRNAAKKVLIDRVLALSPDKVRQIPSDDFVETFFTQDLLDTMFAEAQAKFVEQLHGETPSSLLQETILCEAAGEQYRMNPRICAPTWISCQELKAVDWEEEGLDTLPKMDILMKRKDALQSGWKCLFDMMENLGNVYGDQNVRMVVWFDI